MSCNGAALIFPEDGVLFCFNEVMVSSFLLLLQNDIAKILSVAELRARIHAQISSSGKKAATLL